MSNNNALYDPQLPAVITIHPWHEIGWRGWVVSLQDPTSGARWQRKSYYKIDAKRLANDLKGKTVDEILGRYGTQYFEEVE